jgi:hypothetical protein
LFALFGVALLCTILAINAFMVEMLMAGRGLRAEGTRKQRTADEMEFFFDERLPNALPNYRCQRCQVARRESAPPA